MKERLLLITLVTSSINLILLCTLAGMIHKNYNTLERYQHEVKGYVADIEDTFISEDDAYEMGFDEGYQVAVKNFESKTK